ncbi:hypothetical protein H0H87_002440 [Tephrocybe sp. NHM501043]|nr:hypothetical protein H0H87_002440 [Tephrocybe sp. NHM501043]
MILQVAAQDPNVFIKLSDHGADKVAHTNLKVRTWSILAIAALQEQQETWYTGLFAQLPSFSYAYHGSIRAYCQGSNNSDSAVTDLNHAYIAVKLWVLLAYRISGSGDIIQDSQTFNVWNEMWPPFQELIDRFELDSGGGLYLNAGTLVLSSVAELFIFMRTLHAPIALHIAAHITTLNRLRQLNPGETVNQKLARALRYMSEPPPDTSFETMVNQAAKDMVAAEKLRVLEGKVMQDRKAPEKYRRDARATT